VLSFIAFSLAYFYYGVPLFRGSVISTSLFMWLFILSALIWIGYALLVKEHYIRIQLIFVFIWLAVCILWEYYLMAHYDILFVTGFIMSICSIWMFVKVTRSSL
jgi:putative Ca2+/H+ antiporter (TMEM165/GDT1 family)